MKKLSPPMLDLLQAMQRGVGVHWMGGLNSYAWRIDTRRSVTSTVFALEERGLVAFGERGPGGNCKVELTEEGRNYK